jgi:RNA polymerase sigma factor (sigma-70 family)
MSRTLRGLLQRVTHRLSADAGDGELLARFHVSRDESAFTELVQRHGPMILGVCRRILHDHHDAEDAFQATFLALARKAGSLDGRCSLSCWLHTVACNMSLKVKAGARRRPQPEPAMDIPAEPRDEAAEAEIRCLVDAELGRLPEKYRAPLVLCYLDGKTNEAAARELGWPAGSIAKRLARGRELLRDRLAGRLGVSSALVTAVLAEPARAAVPAGLAGSISQAAVAFAAGRVVGVALVSARAVGLAERALHSMAMARFQLLGICVVMAGMVGIGAGVAWQSVHSSDGAAAPAAKAAPEEIEEVPLQEPEEAAVRDLREKLATPITLDAFDTNTPFREVLGFISERYGVNFTYDIAALRETLRLGKNEDPTEVIGNKPVALFKIVGVPLGEVLELLVNQVSDEHVIRYRATREGVQITAAGPDRAFQGRRLPGAKEDAIAMEPALARSAACIRELQGMLTRPVRIDGFDENTPLREALGFLGERYGITFLLMPRHFIPASIPQPGDTAVRLTPLQNTPIVDVVWALLAPASPAEKAAAAREPQEMTGLELFEPFRKRNGVDGNGTAFPSRFRIRKAFIEVVPVMDQGEITAFSPDGSRYVTTGRYGYRHTVARVWDRRTGRPLGQTTFPDLPLAGIAFTPDGKKLTFLMRYYPDNNQSAGVCRIDTWDIATDAWQGEREVIGARGRFALAPDGKHLVAARDTGATLYDTATDEAVQSSGRFDAPLGSIAFAGDSRTLLALDHVRGCTTAYVWQVGRPLERYPLDVGHGGEGLPVFSANLSHDGRLLAAVDALGRVHLWELASGRCIGELRTPALVRHVAFSPDDRLLAAVSELGSAPMVDLWEIAGPQEAFTSGERRRPRRHVHLCGDRDGQALASLAFSPDGKTLVAGGEGASAVIWDVSRLLPSELPGQPPTRERLEEMWPLLADNDAAQAQAMVRVLAAHPKRSLPFLREYLKPAVAQGDPRPEFERLIKNLDNDDFPRRDAAEKGLFYLGKDIEPMLREVLRRPGRSLEQRRRLERVVLKVRAMRVSPETLRHLRAVQALEGAATPEARALLRKLAQGLPTAPQTKAALEALERLQARSD